MADPAEPANILIVDDTPANLHLLCEIVRERGHRARPVPSGELALQAARASPPDLILLDINMPELDGYQVCQQLKADPALREIPVIFISAHTEIWDKVRAFSVGGVDYITKPFQFEEVHARVATHLELQRQRRQLSQSYQRLRALEQLRDNLVHMVVHDMRSPLTAMITGLGLVQDELAGRIDAQTCQDIDEALTAAQRLAGMANDLLDVSRLEHGKLPITPSECDLTQMIDAAVSSVRGMEPSTRVQIDAAAALRVRCDSRLIGRVLENLVANGLKHSPPGGTLSVVATACVDGARVVVRDQGPGIPAEFRDKIFEKFGVLEARHEHKYHSAGLGLAFCKLAVQAHGGSIGVDSEQGRGSAFWFTLPPRPPDGDDGAVG